MTVEIVPHDYKCTDCGEPHSRKRRGVLKDGTPVARPQSKCGDCHAAYMRAHRKPYSALSSEEKKRSNCRSTTNNLIRRGALEKKPCEVCGSEVVEAHHDDYDDPRNVRWLCKVHHVDLHKGTLTFWQAMGLDMVGEL